MAKWRTNRFKHTKLDNPKTQIRLLQVHRGETTCELQTHDFDEAPPYKAISYTWGPAEDPCSIYVNGRKLTVRRNCWEALRQVHAHGMEHKETLHVWLDAICINQADVAEKSEQVQMMGEIFGRATQVYMFPSLRSEDSPFFVRQIRALLDSPLATIPPDKSYESSQHSGIRSQAIKEFLSGLNEQDSHRFIRGFHEFVSQEYWTRAWIVQEVRLAKVPVIICGCEPVGFTHVLYFVRSFRALISMLKKGRIANTELPYIASAVSDSLVAPYMAEAFELSLCNPEGNLGVGEHARQGFLLYQLRNLQCSDSRDRIFALAKFMEWSPGNYPPIVDYSKSALEVAIDSTFRLGSNVDKQWRSQEKGIDLLARMLQILDVKNTHLKWSYTRSLIRALLSRCTESLTLLPLSVRDHGQLKRSQILHELKSLTIHDWAPVLRDGDGSLYVCGHFGKDADPALSDTGRKNAPRHENAGRTHPTLDSKILNLALKPDGKGPWDGTPRTGYISTAIHPGDLLVRIRSHSRPWEDTKRETCCHVVLQHRKGARYEIIGHAFIPRGVFLGRTGESPRPDHPCSDYARLVLELTICVQDAVAYLIALDDLPDWGDLLGRDFCRRKFSSYGILRPRTDEDYLC